MAPGGGQAAAEERILNGVDGTNDERYARCVVNARIRLQIFAKPISTNHPVDKHILNSGLARVLNDAV